MKKYNYILITLISFFFLVLSCKEEIELETETFESVLVVEATITNELKPHEVKVSRTYLLEESEQAIENNAEVRVIDNTGNSFNFSQNSEGIYVSDIAFEALPDIEYTLEINTTDGKTYNSNQQTLTPISQIDNLYAEYVNNVNNDAGIEVYVDSENEDSGAQYFRYEYEETYKLVAPNYIEFETLLTNYQEAVTYTPRYDLKVYFVTQIIPKTGEQEVCFKTQKNTNIILGETSNLEQNNLNRFPVRFIKFDDGIIRERYSILVKQYVQSLEAYNYYKVIESLSNNESVLSQAQPGYVNGNINEVNNTNSKVIGFFEVTSISEQRIFFNYFDFDLQQPDYPYTCDFYELDYNDNTANDLDRNDRQEIYRLLTEFEEYGFDHHITEIPEPINGIWKIASPECTDCRTVGSNIQPDFWLD